MSGASWGRMLVFTKFTVVQQKGSMDHVMLHTNLPSLVAEEISDDPMHLTMEIRKGHGVGYLCEHFDLEPEDIQVIGVS